MEGSFRQNSEVYHYKPLAMILTSPASLLDNKWQLEFVVAQGLPFATLKPINAKHY